MLNTGSRAFYLRKSAGAVSEQPKYYMMVASQSSGANARAGQSLFPFFQGGIHRIDPNTLEYDYFLKCNSSGINQEPYVMLEYDGKLLIAGPFTQLGDNSSYSRLVEHDGATTFSLFQGTVNNAVRDMEKTGGTAFGTTGDLYVVGDFTNINGVSANRIAKWDGNSWSALGTGLNNYPEKVAVDGSGNVYIAGGRFTTAGGVTVNRIAKWNGSSWSDLGSGFSVNDQVNGLACDSSDNLYVAGEFTSVSGVSVNYFAKWDGTTWSSPGSFNNIIRDMYHDKNNDDFYFAGVFTTIDGNPMNYVAKWDGTTFTNLNDSGTFSKTLFSGISTLGWVSVYNSESNDVYVGYSPTNQGDVCIEKLPYGASAWTLLPINPKRSGGNIPRVRDIFEYDGKIYFCGSIGPAGGVPLGLPGNRHPVNYYERTSGKMNVTNVGTGDHILDGSLNFWWDDYRGRFISYGTSVGLDPDSPTIFEKCDYWKNNEQEWEEFVATNGNVAKPVRIGEFLYFTSGGGAFNLFGNRIAKYNDLTDTFINIGSLNSTGLCLATDSTNLFVGGDFTTAGGVTVNRIAQYDGSSWSNLGGATGANNSVEQLVYATGDSVSDLLYAGGEFTSMQGLANTRGIAAYDPSTNSWQDVGGGLGNGEINDMAWDPENGYLFVAGNFTSIGGQTIDYLAMWDGLTWSDVGGSDAMFNSFSYVRSDRFGRGLYYDTDDKKLYVRGQFVGEDPNTGKAYINLMIWDGTSWDNFPRYEGQDGHSGAGIHFSVNTLHPVPQNEGLTFPVYTPPDKENIVTDGLVLNLDANKYSSYPGFGTKWYDISGNGLTGALTNGPTYDSANKGSIVFDGSDDYVAINYNSSLNPTGGLTISLWAYKSDWDVTTGHRNLISCTESGGWQFSQDHPSFYPNDVGLLVYIAGQYRHVSTPLSSMPNGWNLITGTFDGQYLKIYINGILKETYDHGSSTTITYGTNIKTIIGSEPSSSSVSGQYWSGEVSSVQIYNRALSSTEISQNFNALRGRYGI